jgi:predicted RNase H-like nuclease (RuvC/YqgF family)
LSDKYEFLFSIKMLRHEINELSAYIKESKYCYELLTNKLDNLSKFVVSKENDKQWQLWGEDAEIRKYSAELREVSSKAICTIEKYQSSCTVNDQADISVYMSTLCDSVKKELEAFEINNKSKVVFIGSGAFPISALTIAKQTGAEIMCLDIDVEAVEMGKNIAELTGLESSVSFTNKTVSELSFMKDATHVVIASLVKNKLEVLEELKFVLSEDAKVIIRYGNGLKSMFNYPLDQDLSNEWNYANVGQREHFYDTVVLKKGQVHR